MTNLLPLVRSSLLYYRFRNLLLVLAIALTLFVPLALYATADKAMTSLRARARDTPLILGAAGSDTGLVLHALYFQSRASPPITMAAVEQVQPDRGAAIPLHIEHQAGAAPVVGTSAEYFRLRRLLLQRGGGWERLGDCLLGANVARRLQLAPGDRLTTDPRTVFNLAADYPLRMRVTGVLAPAGNADDDAVFVSMRTAWLVDGIGHGHDNPDPDRPQRDGQSPQPRGFNEVTAANAGRFHFHGDPGGFPCSAALILPVNERAKTLLMGAYASRTDRRLQLVEPQPVMTRLFAAILKVRWAMLLGAILMTLASAMLVVAIMWLTFQLRRHEFRTLARIGASRTQIAGVILGECAVVIAAGVSAALLLSALVSRAHPWLLAWLI